MKNSIKGFAPIAIIVIVVAVLAAASGGYWWWQNKTKVSESVTNQQAGSSQQQVGQDATANWKTYRNQKYGFEVKYPPEFKKIGETTNEIILGSDIEKIKPDSSRYLKISFITTDNSIEKYIENLDKERFSGKEGGITAYDSSTIKLSGHDAVQRKLSALSAFSFVETIIKNFNYIINIYVGSAKSDVDVLNFNNQILSTFKFTK